MSKRKVIHVVLISLYVGFILWITIFSRSQGSERIFKGLFWEIQVGYWRDICLNILLFAPLGFLTKNKKKILLGIVLSILIEATQYFLKLGFCEVDDVINNSIGMIIGFFIYRILYCIYKNIMRKRTDMLNE